MYDEQKTLKVFHSLKLKFKDLSSDPAELFSNSFITRIYLINFSLNYREGEY